MVDDLELFLSEITNYLVDIAVGIHQVDLIVQFDGFYPVRWCFGQVLGTGSNGD